MILNGGGIQIYGYCEEARKKYKGEFILKVYPFYECPIPSFGSAQDWEFCSANKEKMEIYLEERPQVFSKCSEQKHAELKVLGRRKGFVRSRNQLASF